MSVPGCFVVDELERGIEFRLGDNLQKNNFDASCCPLFLRTFNIATEHDFDRMTDRFRMYSRSAPWTAMERGGFTFDKRVLCCDLPPKGTPERDGADAIIGMLVTFIRDHQG
jgi:hypothetical protein